MMTNLRIQRDATQSNLCCRSIQRQVMALTVHSQVLGLDAAKAGVYILLAVDLHKMTYALAWVSQGRTD